MVLICNKIMRKGCTDWWRSCFSFYLCLHPTGILIKILQKRPIQAFNFPHIPLILRQFFDSLDLMQTWYLCCANMFITRAHNKNVLADGKWPLRFLVLQLTKRVEIEEDHLIFFMSCDSCPQGQTLGSATMRRFAIIIQLHLVRNELIFA